MNDREQLKVMAYVDGELAGADLIEAESLIARDADASALANELRMSRAVLRVNEPEAELPMPHAAYWAAIAREIEREPQPAFDWTLLARPAFWLRYLAPVAAVGVILFMAVLQTNPGSTAGDGEELFTSPEASAVVYQSDEQKMTVIWMQSDENSDVPQTADEPY
jgi:anti-sigma factor RsiW